MTKIPTIARIAIHAPARNLVTTTMTNTVPVMTKPIVLMTRDRSMRRRAPGRFGAQQPVPVPDHADLAERERDEHADDVELDQLGDLGAERDTTRSRRRQEQDAVEKAADRRGCAAGGAGNGPEPGSIRAPGSR